MPFIDKRLLQSAKLRNAFTNATAPALLEVYGLQYATMLDTQFGALSLMADAVPALPEDFACAAMQYAAPVGDRAAFINAFGESALAYVEKLQAAAPPGNTAGKIAAFAEKTDPLVKTYLMAATIISLDGMAYTLDTGKTPPGLKSMLEWADRVLGQNMGDPDDTAAFTPEAVESFLQNMKSTKSLLEACRGVNRALETRFAESLARAETLLQWEQRRLRLGPSAPGSAPN